ncbi:MAG: PQQ-dependent sugar dehydrogenase, partial [Halobacteria archaeon]|nr:PQQ-dependent sugar dehydrogenase [Halobacteria archaeon]
ETDGSRTEVRTETVASNLDTPWGVGFDGNDLLFTERRGRLKMLNLGSREVTTLAEVSDTVEAGEGGLLGLALHPDFPDDERLYVYQTYRDGGGGLSNRVLSYTYDGNGVERADTVLDGIPASSVHNGGRIAFGPEGYLYVTCGDAAESRKAQDTGALNGKILRLEDDGSVPSDNPFGDRNPVFSYGHRNPQGLAFRPRNSGLYSTEHGPDTHDEVNIIEKGGNYGWPVVKGESRREKFVDPVTSYTPTIAPGSAEFHDGSFYFGALISEHLHRIEFDGSGRDVASQDRLLEDEFGRLRTVVGKDDALYVTTSNRDGRGTPSSKDDRIIRVEM